MSLFLLNKKLHLKINSNLDLQLQSETDPKLTNSILLYQILEILLASISIKNPSEEIESHHLETNLQKFLI